MMALITLALVIGIALLVIGLVFKIARKLLALVGCAILVLALIGAAYWFFILVPDAMLQF